MQGGRDLSAHTSRGGKQELLGPGRTRTGALPSCMHLHQPLCSALSCTPVHIATPACVLAGQGWAAHWMETLMLLRSAPSVRGPVGTCRWAAPMAGGS